jgi:tRNA(Arg) A34 adenosine deaminase TadA
MQKLHWVVVRYLLASCELLFGMLETAAYIAARSTLKYHQTGAVICDKHGKLISVGWSHHILYRVDRGWTMHAECHAIERAIPDLPYGGTIFVATVARKSGNTTTGKPCPRCDYLIKKAGLNVVHT